MRNKLMNFLKLLEAKLPPPEGCHYAITLGKYGSDDAQWEDKLGLQIIRKSPEGTPVFQTLFIDDGDLEKAPSQLVSECLSSLSTI